jgi:hypothetical protein
MMWGMGMGDLQNNRSADHTISIKLLLECRKEADWRFGSVPNPVMQGCDHGSQERSMAQNNAAVEKEIAKAEKSILRTVVGAGIAISPSTAIRSAVNEGVRESIARSAIWFLLDKNEISLTNDRKLAAIEH